MSVSVFGFDSTTIVLVLAVALGGLGLKRGIRTEGITLAGVLGATVVLGSDSVRERLAQTINKLPRVLDLLISSDATVSARSADASIWLKTPDQKLVFYVILFAVLVALSYFVGAKFGTQATARIERLIGGVMGAASGLAIGIMATGFSHGYLSRHPNGGGTAIALTSIQTPLVPVGSSLGQYTLAVLLVAVGAAVTLAVMSLRRARFGKAK